MPTVLSPGQWGAQVNYDTWDDPFTPDDGVALHHGGGFDYPAGRTPYNLANEIAQFRAWEDFHLRRGWRGIAYGWGVGQTGTILRARAFNRYGAHTGDVDGDGIANNDEVVPIIWIASGNHHTISPAAAASIEWLRRNVILPRSPAARYLYGHTELRGTVTACPGPAGMAYVTTHRIVEETDMASPGQKLMVDLALNLFPEEVKVAPDNPNFWYDLPENDPQWDTHFRPALSLGAQRLYQKVKAGGGTHDHDGRYLTDVHPIK